MVKLTNWIIYQNYDYNYLFYFEAASLSVSTVLYIINVESY